MAQGGIAKAAAIHHGLMRVVAPDLSLSFLSRNSVCATKSQRPCTRTAPDPRGGGTPGDVAAQSFAKAGGAVGDEVKAAAVALADPKRAGVGKPLSSNDPPIPVEGFPTHPHPGLFEDRRRGARRTDRGHMAR